jgi:hypothetical protein
MPTTRLVGSAPNQVPRNRDLGALAFQDIAQRNIAGQLASAAGLTAVTAVTGSLTLATGGVTLLNQIMINNVVWRIRAFGTYAASSSTNVRQLTMRCFWGSTALTPITTGNVLVSQAQTTPWSVDFVITGSSTTVAWITGFLSSSVTFLNNTTVPSATYTASSAPVVQNYIATAAAIGSLSTAASTLDFRVGQTGTATSGDTINVHSVVIERIQ